jgi:hypothetical protein
MVQCSSLAAASRSIDQEIVTHSGTRSFIAVLTLNTIFSLMISAPNPTLPRRASEGVCLCVCGHLSVDQLSVWNPKHVLIYGLSPEDVCFFIV